MYSPKRAAPLTAGLLACLLTLAASIPTASFPHSRAFGGVPYVGALFRDSNGVLGSHFCTASVVSSPRGNLLITSAHCVSGRDPASVAFAPGYASGAFPYGVYPLTAIYTDTAWSAHHDINDDTAFLQIGSDIEPQTGSLNLATGQSPQLTNVIGYPDGASEPVRCSKTVTWFRKGRQMKFVCAGYPDGTSGGPWVIHSSQVYGVIGGYQQGGLLSYISYSPYFGSNILALYRQAVASDKQAPT
jgi:hypothetical protein